MTFNLADDSLELGGRRFSSRLIVGTGKYASLPLMKQALEASGTEIVTVAVRRINLNDRSGESLLSYIDTKKFMLLPNTAGCYSAGDAVRIAQLGREAGLSEWVKLEVIGDERTLFPDTEALLEATKVLVKDGFVVLPYTNDGDIVYKSYIESEQLLLKANALKQLYDSVGIGKLPDDDNVIQDAEVRRNVNLKLLTDTIRLNDPTLRTKPLDSTEYGTRTDLEDMEKVDLDTLSNALKVSPMLDIDEPKLQTYLNAFKTARQDVRFKFRSGAIVDPSEVPRLSASEAMAFEFARLKNPETDPFPQLKLFANHFNISEIW